LNDTGVFPTRATICDFRIKLAIESVAISQGDVAALNYFIADKYIRASNGSINTFWFGERARSPNRVVATKGPGRRQGGEGGRRTLRAINTSTQPSTKRPIGGPSISSNFWVDV
jgi:hypothetical protein